MPAPANDLRANAQLISGGSGSDSGTTVGCIADSDSGGVYDGWNDVWFYWSSLSARRLRLTLDTGSAVYTEAALYAHAHASAAGAGNPNFLGFVGTSDGTALACEVDHPGGELTLVVASDVPDETAFAFSWESPSAPANDNRASAQLLTGASGSTTGTTKGATGEGGTVYGADMHDVWYYWADQPAGPINVSLSPTSDGDYFIEIALWAESPSGAATNLTHLLGNSGFDDPGPIPPHSLSVVHPGGDLTLSVVTTGYDTTSFDLSWSSGSAGSASASMIGSGVQEATNLASAEAAYAKMIGVGLQSATSPAKGHRPRAIVVDINGTTLCELPDAKIGTISYGLNQPESWTISLLQNDPATVFTSVPFQEVQVWRGDQLLAWGPCTRWGYDQDHWVGQYKGTMWYLQRRYIGKANRKNWLANGSFEDELNGWGFTTNPVLNFFGYEGAQADPPLHESVVNPRVEGQRAMGLENFVTQADAWAGQEILFTVDPGTSPEGETWTIKGWFYLTQQITAANLAWGSRGLYIERFSTTQLNPRADVQEALPGAKLSIEVQFVPFDEKTPVGVWTRFEKEMTQPITGQGEIIDVRLYAPAGIEVYWDAVSLTLIEKLAFYNTDQALIVKGIVEHLQNAAYDKSNLNISTDTPLTGIIRTRIYKHQEHPPGWRAITEFNELVDGMDYQMVYTPTKRTFTTHYPRSGVYKPAYPVRLETDVQTGNIAAWNVSFDGEGASSSVVVLGSGNGSDREEGGAIDVSGWANGVTHEEVFTAPDQTPIDSLGAMALERLRAARNPYTVDVTLYPHAGLIGNVWPGDDIDVTILRGGLDIEGQWRVVKSTIDVESGQMQLTLNPPVTT